MVRALLAAATLIPVGCAAAGSPGSVSGPPLGEETSITFVDATDALGLDGIAYPADLRRAKIIATMGGGAAWGDYDGDGDPDLYVTQGVEKDRPGRTSTRCGILFRNDGSRGFRRVSHEARISACGWGSGATFEDVDLDGDVDLFLTFVGANQLWRNDGDGTFTEVAGAWGLSAPGYNSGAAFLDHDRDGDLDLYVTRYVETTLEAEREWPALQLRMPEEYPAPDNALLRQEAPGHWVDATTAAGVADPEGRGLAVVAADLDLDGWTDLFVANDRSANALLRNRGDGSFEDVTDLAGVGVGADGHWESAMGVAVGDVDGNGYPDLLVTNYVDEPNSLFLNLGDLVFVDATREQGLHRAALPWVGWGAELVDFDDDGRLDLYVVNGHLVPDWIARLGYWLRRDELIRAYTLGGYRQPVLLFRGGDEGFEVVDTGEDGLLGRRIAGRGGVTADVDGDGRLDLFVLSLAEKSPSALLLNRSGGRGGWLGVDLRSRGGPVPAPGSRLRVEAADRTLSRQVVSGGSYLSSSAVPTHFGIGSGPTTVDLETIRPAGSRTRYLDLPRDRLYLLF